MRYPTHLINDPHLKHLVLRCPRTPICGAEFQVEEREALPTHGENRCVVADETRIQVAAHVVGPLGRRDASLAESDDPPTALDRHVRSQQVVYVVPRLTIDRIDQPQAGLRTGVSRFDGRGFGL